MKRLARGVRRHHVEDLGQAGSFADLGEGLTDFGRILRAPWTTGQAIRTARTGHEGLRAPGLRRWAPYRGAPGVTSR